MLPAQLRGATGEIRIPDEVERRRVRPRLHRLADVVADDERADPLVPRSLTPPARLLRGKRFAGFVVCRRYWSINLKAVKKLGIRAGRRVRRRHPLLLRRRAGPVAAVAAQLLRQGREPRALPRREDPADQPQARLRRAGHAAVRRPARPNGLAAPAAHRQGERRHVSDDDDRPHEAADPPPAVHRGVADQTLDGSQPDWELIGHVEPPEGAPNVLVVLIDDAGFGNPSTFGGPIDTPNYDRMADAGAALQPLPRHGDVLADPGGAAHGPQPPRGRDGRHPGVLRRLPGLLGDAAAGRGAVPEGPEGERLLDGGDRQVAPDAGGRAGTGRPVRPLAERLGLRLLLGLPGSRGRPVRHDDRREPEVHRRRRRARTASRSTSPRR